MKLLLTSAGIYNDSIRNALVEMLNKPIAECNALCIPTAAYAGPGGAQAAWRLVSGRVKNVTRHAFWRAGQAPLGWIGVGRRFAWHVTFFVA